MRFFFVGLVAYFVFFIHASFAQQPMHFPIDKDPLMVSTAKGIFSYDVEIAKTQEQSSAGLMFRTDFPKNRAMLFKFSESKIVTMWMANTPLPLDMVFLDKNGVVVSFVKNTTPFSFDIISSKLPAAFTIEFNSGEINAKNISVGQQFYHPSICGNCKTQ